jgi:hypothetical protein
MHERVDGDGDGIGVYASTNTEELTESREMMST